MIEDDYAVCPVCGMHYTFTHHTDRCPVCCPVDKPYFDPSLEFELSDEVYDDDD
jgi:rubrerythrin